MSIYDPTLPNLYEKMIQEWLAQPKEPPPPDKVVYPIKLFHYPGGFKIGKRQKPVMVRRKKRRES